MIIIRVRVEEGCWMVIDSDDFDVSSPWKFTVVLLVILQPYRWLPDGDQGDLNG